MSLHIGADIGNFQKSSTNYTCNSPLEIEIVNAVPPSIVSVFNATGLPSNFFSDPPTSNASDLWDSLRLVQGLGTLDGVNTTARWDINVEPGAYVGFAVQDSTGRAVYDGDQTASSNCQLRPSVDEPPSFSERPARVGSWPGNVYAPTPEYSCSPAYITYDTRFPPTQLDAVSADNLPSSFFVDPTTYNSTNMTVLSRIATLNSTGGIYSWTVPTDLPLGTRFLWRVTDSNGYVGFSESRTIYPASADRNSSAYCRRQGTIYPADSSNDDGSSSNLSGAARAGMTIAAVAGFAIVIYLLLVACGAVKSPFKNRRQRRARPLESQTFPIESSSSSSSMPLSMLPRIQRTHSAPLHDEESTLSDQRQGRSTRRPPPPPHDQLPSYNDAIKSPPHAEH